MRWRGGEDGGWVALGAGGAPTTLQFCPPTSLLSSQVGPSLLWLAPLVTSYHHTQVHSSFSSFHLTNSLSHLVQIMEVYSAFAHFSAKETNDL